jgi:hypothetical protein
MAYRATVQAGKTCMAVNTLLIFAPGLTQNAGWLAVFAGPAHTRGQRSGPIVIPASSAAQGLLPHEGPSAHAVRPRSDSPDQSPTHRRNTRSPDRATTADDSAAPGTAGGDKSSPKTSPIRQAGLLFGRPVSAGPLAPPTSPASTRVLSPPPSQPHQQVYSELPPQGVQGQGIAGSWGRGLGYLGGYAESSWHPSFLKLPYAPVGPYMRQDPIEALIDSLHVSQTMVPHIAQRKQHHVQQMQQYETMKQALQTAQVSGTGGVVGQPTIAGLCAMALVRRVLRRSSCRWAVNADEPRVGSCSMYSSARSEWQLWKCCRLSHCCICSCAAANHIPDMPPHPCRLPA